MSSLHKDVMLLIPFRSLATGNTFMFLSFQFRTGRPIIAQIARETCSVTWTHPREQMGIPLTEDWEQIAQGL